MMKLLRFRVKNFRSVVDSDWITTENVTALIGTNESGKTNLLIPLWKLNPAKGGEINPLADYPRKRYNEIREMSDKPVFIEAEFELDDKLAYRIATMTSSNLSDVRIVSVSRHFGGGYYVGFPNQNIDRSVQTQDVQDKLTSARLEIERMEPGKTEETLKNTILKAIDAALDILPKDNVRTDGQLLKKIYTELESVNQENALKRSTIVPRFGQLQDIIDEMVVLTSKKSPNETPEARQLVRTNLPSFVYYSNYGNLDSEIYLPHVIENMERNDLGSREEAKARTLKVLFEFVKLQPKEIWELGKDTPVIITRRVNANTNQLINEEEGPEPTEEQIREVAAKKKEREVLLTSASADLTTKFRNWWRQGEYRFRFDADGDHFRIWVSDDRRPEEIELEGRSTGLQWFLSFYLTFLVESADDHKDAILLLDEPGQSLHPLAQRDLSKFFDNLAQTNQILYTAHSPFLVDSDHLDRVKAVYVNDEGATEVSSDLRANQGNKAQERSIYPVNAALGLSVSESMLEGCQPVVVEGQSDQLYLSAIKTFLIRNAAFAPMREMVFVPTGGVKGVSSVMPILAAKTDALPYILLDSDTQGTEVAKSLRNNMYKGATDRIISAGDICEMDGAEIEDFFPTTYFAGVIDKYLRGQQEEDFVDVAQTGKPIIPQVEAYAMKHGLTLSPGWKVEVAKRIKSKLLNEKDPSKIDADTLARWNKLFETMRG